MNILFIAYDNASYTPWFPQHYAALAAVLSDHKITVWHQDINHWPDESLTGYLDYHHEFDIVCLGMIAGYWQYKKLSGLSKAINASVNRHKFKYVLGGHMFSPDPEYFLNLINADCVICGEGELVIRQLLEDFPNTARVYSGELIKNIDSLPHPKYSLFHSQIPVYRLLRMAHCESTDFVMPILSGRGCSFFCNFCYRLMPGIRLRSAKNILEEIRYLINNYGITYFTFADELLMESKQRTIELCAAFNESGYKFKWDCNGRLNYASPDVLSIMKQSGCVFINYGIEAYDDQVLKNMNKALTVKQIDTGIQNTLNAGISPGFNIIWGNIGDNERTLWQGVGFLLKYDNHSQIRTIRPVTAYPGTPLFDIAIKRGLVKDVHDFYTNKHVNSDLISMNFTELSTDKCHELLYEANSCLLEKYYKDKCLDSRLTAKKLYLEKNVNFRGFR